MATFEDASISHAVNHKTKLHPVSKQERRGFCKNGTPCFVDSKHVAPVEKSLFSDAKRKQFCVLRALSGPLARSVIKGGSEKAHQDHLPAATLMHEPLQQSSYQPSISGQYACFRCT